MGTNIYGLYAFEHKTRGGVLESHLGKFVKTKMCQFFPSLAGQCLNLKVYWHLYVITVLCIQLDEMKGMLSLLL